MSYKTLSADIEAQIAADIKNGTPPQLSCNDADAVRTFNNRDLSTLMRPPFARDIDKIMHCPFYNRYADKTQVFTFYKNDDISRRSLHVQLVSRIARNIGKILNLNLDLIEAIALGHDMGHTPFGHAGERCLDEILNERCSLRFAHNVQSVRVLNEVFPYNLTLQTLDGIICHNGEAEQCKYVPTGIVSTRKLELYMTKCAVDIDYNRQLMPATLEGCLVRVCDMIAYLGKDRQDAVRANLTDTADSFGYINAEIINNLSVSIVENSYNKPYIMLDNESFEFLSEIKRKNYEHIYNSDKAGGNLTDLIKPMMSKLFDTLLSELKSNNTDSIILKHHINKVCAPYYEKNRTTPYEEQMPELIVADYIASMTDDYFVDLYAHLFPKDSIKIKYNDYF